MKLGEDASYTDNTVILERTVNGFFLHSRSYFFTRQFLFFMAFNDLINITYAFFRRTTWRERLFGFSAIKMKWIKPAVAKPKLRPWNIMMVQDVSCH